MHLEHGSALAVCWFESNYLKLNTDKCSLIIISGNRLESLRLDKGMTEYGSQIMSIFMKYIQKEA